MKTKYVQQAQKMTGHLLLGRIILAYIDPNTGGMLFQFLAAGFTAISGFVLVFGRRIKMWWAGKRRVKREKSGLAEPDVNSEMSSIPQPMENE